MPAHSLYPLAVLALLAGLSVTVPSTHAQEHSAAGLSSDDVSVVVERTLALVDSHYVFPEKASSITAPVRQHHREGRYREAAMYGAAGPDSLASWLTEDLRAASGDRHLYVEHLPTAPEEAFDPEAWVARERTEERLENFGFTEARVLDGNVGYLRITQFMHPDRGYEAARAAMSFLARTDALVIDLRGNSGGYGGLMELVLAYFFTPAPTHLSTTYASGGEPTKTFTLPFVPGRRRVGDPLCVLVDGGTGSAAEYFAYTLQAFDKATVVGQPTAGAAHRNSYYDVDAYLGPGRFRASVSTGAPVNAVTGTNWEGDGVQPDLVVPTRDALMAAHRHLLETDLPDAPRASSTIDEGGNARRE